MAVRAGIVITGTEVLSGRVTDRNGPWLSERLQEVGVEHVATLIVGDRPHDITDGLRYFAEQGAGLVVTSGGLGPTADDLTAEVVGSFQGREMVLDEPLEGRIWDILEVVRKRWPNIDERALRESNRKQAVVPVGATVLEPVGTAPGLVVPPAEGTTGPTVVVLPGPPRELQPMWRMALAADAMQAALSGATEYESRMLRLFGIPESEIAETLRQAAERGVALDELEITTCLRRGEVEVVTRYEPPAAAVYDAFVDVVRERHGDTLFSDDGSQVDDQVARLLVERRELIGTAESCTAGLLAARLTDKPGSSAYVRGGLVVYSNTPKIALAGVPSKVIDEHGAVSTEVAELLADGARRTLGATVGVGITGIAGPDGGTEDKPVGTVCFSVSHTDGSRITRRAHLPGSRADVRDRSTTVAMHMIRRLLEGESDLTGAGGDRFP